MTEGHVYTVFRVLVSSGHNSADHIYQPQNCRMALILFNDWLTLLTPGSPDIATMLRIAAHV